MKVQRSWANQAMVIASAVLIDSFVLLESIIVCARQASTILTIGCS